MKRANLSGIFSAVFVAATVIMLASCSQDDEYYEDGLFTRADEMMTRAGEPGGYTPTPTPPPVQKIAAGADTSYYRELFPVILELVISWPEGYTSVTAHPVNPSLSVGFLDYLDIAGNIQYEIKETTAQWCGASAVYGTFRYIGKGLGTNIIVVDSTCHFVETVEEVFISDNDEAAVDSL